MTAVPSQEVEVQITSPCFLNFLDEIAKKIHEFEASAICYRLQSAPNYSVSILVERTAWCRAQNERDEILTVIRLGLPHELRRSLACTNIVENALGTVRQVTRNVKRWRHAEMDRRRPAQKTFRRLKAYRQLPILRNALQEHLRKAQADSAIETIMKAHSIINQRRLPHEFQQR